MSGLKKREEMIACWDQLSDSCSIKSVRDEHKTALSDKMTGTTFFQNTLESATPRVTNVRKLTLICPSLVFLYHICSDWSDDAD